MQRSPILVRVTTIPLSMRVLLKGQIQFMREHGFDVKMISSDSQDKNLLEQQEGAELITVPFTRRITPFQDLICLFQLIRIFRKIRPDIVHTHTPKAGLLGMWAARLSGVPLRMHTVAGLPWMEKKGLLRQLLRMIEKLTAMASTGVYPNSFALKRFMLNEKIASRKLDVIGAGSSNGVDDEFFRCTDSIREEALRLREQTMIQKDDWVWIFIGRVVRDKGVSELLQSFKSIREQFRGDQLWILGEEEPGLDPLSEADRAMLTSAEGIHCWGFREDIRPFLLASQALVFPSYREGFPNVPMQAALMGTMLLLSDINGCNEIVEDRVNGLLVQPKNTSALTRAMLFIRKNEYLREQYAERARDKIQSRYSRRTVQNQILEEYKKQLRKKKLPLPTHA
jgi:glycosyltransferase involved in cell wall biosynthesis